MSAEYDDYGEGEEYPDAAQLHITKFHFPEDHQHPSGSILIKEQVFYFSAIKAARGVVISMEERIGILNIGLDPKRYVDFVKSHKKPPRTDKELENIKLTDDEVRQIEHEGNMQMINSLSEHADWQTDYAVSEGGMGRKQGTGIAASQRTGMSPQPKKQSMMDKILGKNKGDDVFPLSTRQ